MTCDPYLVLGTGRSGTSVVAGIMHNKMGIFMGHEFPPHNETNPDGFWEDIEFYNANKEFVFGAIKYPTWQREVRRIILERQKLNKPWGFKESRMAHLIGLYLGFFKKPKIIRCEREKELVIASLVRCYGFSEEYATNFWQTRKVLLDNTLSEIDHLTIYFDGARTLDGKIVSLIKEKWPESGGALNVTA